MRNDSVSMLMAVCPSPGREHIKTSRMRPSVRRRRGFGLALRLRQPRLFRVVPRVRGRLGVVHHPECSAQTLAQKPRLDDEPLVLADRATLHLPCLGMRLGEDQLGLAARLLLQLGRRALRGDERRAQQRLELLEADEVGLELLDLVRQVGALAPHVLEARGDLLEQPVGGAAVVAEEPRARSHVSDLDWCECHSLLPLSSGTFRGSSSRVA